MVTKEFMAKVRAALEEAFCKGNLNAMDQIEDPNVVVHVYPFLEAKGLQAVKQAFSSIGTGFSDTRLQWEEMISEGDSYAARCVIRMKHTGSNPLFPVPPTGKEVVVNFCFFAREKNGKNIEVFEYDDWLGFLQQLGIVPAMGQK